MCAAPNSTSTTTVASPSMGKSMDSNPRKNKPSHEGKNAYMSRQQGNSALPQKPKPNGSSRNEKRARWAKKNRPVPKPVVKQGPAKEYACVCHGEPATKPRAATKFTVKDHDSGKLKETPSGLGHWHCSVTRKGCKVTPRKPQPKVVSTGTIVGADPGRGSEVPTASLTV